ncbi:MAG: methyltransferase domain-containing protein [Betaproteobacteria bacterium]|nr:methyltransferase domain-containing protein [Betaproteobacteria bacterium]
MFANSRSVESRQTEAHPALPGTLARHFARKFCQPIRDYNRAAFAEAIGRWQDWNDNAPLLLDCGCGVGWSTIKLASAHPDCFVLGIDQSAHRLARKKSEPSEYQQGNLAFIRADLVDFWRLLADMNIRLSAHYLLYPNPWPKARHLKRRWHGHPVFPALLSLGGRLECRSNWKIYLDELEFAINWAGYAATVTAHLPADGGLTPFERKYHASGQPLWKLVADLDHVKESPNVCPT